MKKSRPTAKRIRELEARVKELDGALMAANTALFDIAGVVDLLREEASIGDNSFPEIIAAPIRMIGDYARHVAHQTLEVV